MTSIGPLLAMLSNAVEGEGDGIGDHTRLLQFHLEEIGIRSDVLARMASKWLVRRTSSNHFEPGHPPDTRYRALLVHYNPFMYGRRGVAPWLPALLWQLHRQHPRPRIALMAHETYMPMLDVRTSLMSAWQRAQLRSVAAASDAVGASIEHWRDVLAGYRPRKTAFHLPIPSNLPDARGERARVRRLLGAREQTLVVATLSTGHPSHLTAYAETAIRALATDVPSVLYLRLGRGALPHNCTACRSVMPGYVPADQLAAYLAAADLFLSPLVDGISTRRTSVMAAMEHSLAVVGTVGYHTDQMLLAPSTGLRLTRVGDLREFINEARQLGVNAERLRSAGLSSRAFYSRFLDWPSATRRYLAFLSAAGATLSEPLTRASLSAGRAKVE